MSGTSPSDSLRARGRSPVELAVAGRLVLAGGDTYDGEVGVAQGRIIALAERGDLDACERIDAGRRLVLPGHVDVHVHTGSEPAEGIAAATAAAAVGGATTIVDMPYDHPDPVTSVAALVDKQGRVEQEAVVDVALYATVADEAGLDAIDPLIDAGAMAFKLSTFETHPRRFPRVPDDVILLALERLAGRNIVAAFHAENDEIVRRMSAIEAAGGRTDGPSHARARPPIAETEAIGRILELALATGAPVHICHVSVPRGFELVARARRDGIDATAETCGHYLLLDERALATHGGRAKCNPPLRTPADVEALWRLLAHGGIDIVSSDHVGWGRASKEVHPISDAKAGFPGVELTLPLLFSEGVVNRGLPLRRLVEVVCERPARRYGLWPRKGSLRVGADADLVVLDPEHRWRVDEDELTCGADWSPYHGREVTGRIDRVLLRGTTVAAGGRVVGGLGGGVVQRPSGAHAPVLA